MGRALRADTVADLIVRGACRSTPAERYLYPIPAGH